MVSTQRQELLPIMEEFPGEAERCRQITDNADLTLLACIRAPCLRKAGSLFITKYYLEQPLSHCNKELLNFFPTLGKPFIGPHPVLLKVPTQVHAFLLRQRVKEEDTDT